MLLGTEWTSETVEEDSRGQGKGKQKAMESRGRAGATREAATGGGRGWEAKEEAGEGGQVQRGTNGPGGAGGGARRGDSVWSAQSAWVVEEVFWGQWKR